MATFDMTYLDMSALYKMFCQAGVSAYDLISHLFMEILHHLPGDRNKVFGSGKVLFLSCVFEGTPRQIEPNLFCSQ